jgi:hypothetical protein
VKTDEPSDKPFHDLTASEADEVKRTHETPGWGIILRRLHWAQAETLQAYLDSKDEGVLGEFRGLKRAEKLSLWMLLEPGMKSKVKGGGNIPIPYEGVTAEDIANLEFKDADHD